MSELHISFEGQSILAAPSMDDPNFSQSVVYMVRHTPEDAIGLVINRPSSVRIQQVIKSMLDIDLDCQSPLFRGGPVDGPLVLIHDQPDASDLSVAEDIFLSSDAHHIQEVIANPDATFRLIDGFAGWGPGQLEEEFETGCWLRSDIAFEDLFSDPHDLWKRLIYRVGEHVISRGKPSLRKPSRASWN